MQINNDTNRMITFSCFIKGDLEHSGTGTLSAKSTIEIPDCDYIRILEIE